MMSVAVLSLLCLLQVWPSSSRFVFEFDLVTVDTVNDENCDPPEEGVLRRCEPFLATFCLREGRDTQSIPELEGREDPDCPLGVLGLTPDGTRIIAYTPGYDFSFPLPANAMVTTPGLPDGPVNRTFMSEESWPVRHTISPCINKPARELDPGPCSGNPLKCMIGDDPLDDIFINRSLEVNADFTPIERYNGTNTINRVVLDMRFRVMCQQDYYGADCTRFCVAQNDSVNGYYTCNSDGSFRCREGFRNPSNNCTEVVPACESAPRCANGGSCTSMGAINFTCQCAVGYTGTTCEINIDDCPSATCPSNSKCMDGVNTFECTCFSGFEKVNDSCVESPNTDLPLEIIGIPIAAIGAGVAVPLVVIILIIIVIVVLVLVLSKRRAQKPYQIHQGEHRKDNLANSAHQLEEKVTPTTAIYATPSSPEPTVHKVENPVYGDISDNEDDVNAHDFQNPVYGKTEDDGAQKDELYTTPQAPQPVGTEGDGPEYDYAMNPGAGAVTVNVKTNSSTPGSHEYTVMDESKRNKVELDIIEPYERLHHGTEPPDFVRLAEIEGAEYGSLQ